MTLNICAENPSGRQLAIPTVPPGLTTRNSSAAARSGRGANIAPNTDRAASNEPSSNGSSSASASTHSMSSPSADVRARPCSTCSGA
jgi:hypothetical protein